MIQNVIGKEIRQSPRRASDVTEWRHVQSRCNTKWLWCI